MARLKPYFQRATPFAILALFATVLAASTEPLIPMFLQKLLDSGFAEGVLPLWMVPAALILMFALRGSAQFVAHYSLSRITNDSVNDLRKVLFNRLLHADLSLFAKQSASSLSNTIVYEVQGGAQQLVGAIQGLTRDGLTLVALLGYLLYLNWRLTLLIAIVIPGVSWVMKTLSRRLYSLTRQSQNATDDLAYVVEENVLAHRIVRLHAAQESQASRFARLSEQLRRLALKSTVASAAMTPLIQLLAAVSLSMVLALALWESQNTPGRTVGGFVAFVSAMLLLISPLKRLGDVMNPITRGLASIERGLQLLDTVQTQTEGQHSSPRASGLMELHEVLVRYREDQAALDRVSLRIEPGSTVALVGPSGSGKTTLVNLLPRFVQAQSGSVCLDGVPVEQWSLSSLRQQFALVSQDVVMLHDTVAANVALGQNMDRQRVQQCLEAAHLSAHVQSLPQGMDTVLGHNASQLSGGQRQRLAIARALYKDAPILILDEATSALDNESERVVQAALQQLMKDRTTVIIAHRLSTIEHADRIVVMEQGQIVEEGRHSELLTAQGTYARLHRMGAWTDASVTSLQDLT